jgi:acetyl esterase/lipase
LPPGLKSSFSLRHYPPTFIFFASDDQSVNPKNSLLFYAALLDNKVSATRHIFPTGGHSIPVKNGAGSSAVWTQICELWMAEIGILPQAKK